MLLAIDLFAGGGGAALGLHRAEFRHLAAIERDPAAAATLTATGLPVVCADLAEVDLSEYAGQVDLLWASPPCQPYSRAGRQLGSADPRDGWGLTLPRDGWGLTLRAIKQTAPRWVVIVAGLEVRVLADAPAEHLASSLIALDQSLVDLWDLGFAAVEWRLLNAADYGLPQHRRRVFLVAGPAPIRWPSPTHADPAALPLFGWLRPSASLALATGRRKLTIQECAILQGFPEDHPWRGGKTAIYRQIWNAVPPLLAEILGRAIYFANRSTKQ